MIKHDWAFIVLHGEQNWFCKRCGAKLRNGASGWNDKTCPVKP